MPAPLLKNFVLDSVGKSWNAERINVLIDNDFVDLVRQLQDAQDRGALDFVAQVNVDNDEIGQARSEAVQSLLSVRIALNAITAPVQRSSVVLANRGFVFDDGD